MANIKILDGKVVDKIAAGEVVERPAAVVKELIENSIDAGAKRIIVNVPDQDAQSIRIEDDGSGMSKDDAMLSIHRHATSKIISADDLFDIHSLGFRGEALASIAAVSMIRITTKTESSDVGIRIDAEGSKLIAVKEVSANKGTIIEVSNLFYNTPARKKYMKSGRQERGVIADIMTRYALCYPEISFRLDTVSGNVLKTNATSDIKDTIASIYGHDVAKDMIPVSHKGKACNVRGLIGKPAIARKDRSFQSVFVNGRYVKAKEITDGLYDGYHSMLFVGRHPISVLFVDIDPKKLDVNVHPAKDIIRIEDHAGVKDDVAKAVRNTLKGADLIPESEIDVRTGLDRRSAKSYAFEKDRQSVLVKENMDDSSLKTKSAVSKPAEDRESISDAEFPLKSVSKELSKERQTGGVSVSYRSTAAVEGKAFVAEPERRFGPFRVIGQIGMTYILAESADGLMIIDQHAAEERVNYEILLEEFHSKGISTQKLMKPQVYETTSKNSAAINDNLNVLKRTGFIMESYGSNSFLVRAIPTIFGRFYESLIDDVVLELERARTKVDELKEERIIRFSCRRSIKAGKELTRPEMERLIERLEETEHPFTCPHGRPTIIRISIAELERKFKRA